MAPCKPIPETVSTWLSFGTYASLWWAILVCVIMAFTYNRCTSRNLKVRLQKTIAISLDSKAESKTKTKTQGQTLDFVNRMARLTTERNLGQNNALRMVAVSVMLCFLLVTISTHWVIVKTCGVCMSDHINTMGTQIAPLLFTFFIVLVPALYYTTPSST